MIEPLAPNPKPRGLGLTIKYYEPPTHPTLFSFSEEIFIVPIHLLQKKFIYRTRSSSSDFDKMTLF